MMNRAVRTVKTNGACAILAMTLLSLAAMLGGCSGKGGGLFTHKPFVPTPVPRDFAISIDQDRSTYFSRQHIHQVISASDMMSRTVYTTYSDYRNTVANTYRTLTPLNRDQLQNMWNEVRRHHLLRGAFTWYFWQSPGNEYHQNQMIMQIRANGRERVYHQLNHWDSNKATLALDCEAVRLPLTQNAKAMFPPKPATSHGPSNEGPPSNVPASAGGGSGPPLIQPVPAMPANRSGGTASGGSSATSQPTVTSPGAATGSAPSSASGSEGSNASSGAGQPSTPRRSRRPARTGGGVGSANAAGTATSQNSAAATTR